MALIRSSQSRPPFPVFILFVIYEVRSIYFFVILFVRLYVCVLRFCFVVLVCTFTSGHSDKEIKRLMDMDHNVFKDFLRERAVEVQHASEVISQAIVDNDTETKDKQKSTPNSTTATAAAAGDASQVDGGAEDTGAKSFLSKRARAVVDGVLNDPDIDELRGRVQGFARGRLLQAEAAARVWKGGDDSIDKGNGTSSSSSSSGNGEKNVTNGNRIENNLEVDEDGKAETNHGGDVGGKSTHRLSGNEVARASSTQTKEGMDLPGVGDVGGVSGEDSTGSDSRLRGKTTRPDTSETPILSELARNTRGFVESRLGELKDGARDVWESAAEVRRSRSKESKQTTATIAGGEEELPSETGEAGARRDKGKRDGVSEASRGDRGDGDAALPSSSVK